MVLSGRFYAVISYLLVVFLANNLKNSVKPNQIIPFRMQKLRLQSVSTNVSDSVIGLV